MAADHYRRSDCRICGSKRIELAFPMPASPVGDDYRKADQADRGPHSVYPMDVYYCGDCGLIQLTDVVSPRILYGTYLYETSISLGLPDHFKKYAAHVIEKLRLAPGSQVLDIGCNDATLLRAFQEQGMKVYGIDPAESIAKKVKAQFAIDVIPAVLDRKVAAKAAAAHGKAALVTANNVVANIDDLGEFAAAVNELLAQDGVFVLESGYALDLARKCVFDNIYHEHISYFSVKPLRTFCEKNGFMLFDVERVPTKGGSIRIFAQRKGGKQEIQPAVARLIAEEESFGLYDSKTLLGVGETIRKNGNDLVALLKKLKSEGKRIAGYGASVGSTTVICNYGLAEYLTCLFDDNSVKFDTVSPGFKIPVFSSARIAEKRPDYILIVSWMYNEPIMARNERFVRDGGKFITFKPELAVL